LETFINLVDGVKLITILALIGVDFLLGVILAVKEGKFQLARIAEFLNTSVLYFLGGYLLLGLAATVEPSIGQTVVTAAWGLLDVTMVGFIIDKAKKLGLPLPDKILGFLNLSLPPEPAGPPQWPLAMVPPPPPRTDTSGKAPTPSPWGKDEKKPEK